MHDPTKHPDPRILKAEGCERGERSEEDDRAETANRTERTSEAPLPIKNITLLGNGVIYLAKATTQGGPSKHTT